MAIVLGAVSVALFVRRSPKRPVEGARIPTGGAAAAGSTSSSALVVDQTIADPDSGAASANAKANTTLVEDARSYVVHTWSFNLDRFDVRIEDAGMSRALDDVLKRTKADFVVNGGFFDPNGRPVGFAMSNGVVLSKLGKNLSGGVLTLGGAPDAPHAELFASESFEIPPDAGVQFAIQCRPRLVVDRAANVKSDDGKRAERTALCVRDAGVVMDVVIVRGSDDGESRGPSLFALARHLAEAGCESALNLDGGPSTGAAWREKENGEATRLITPRGPVRHVVAFSPR